MKIHGKLVDIHTGEIYGAEVTIEEGKIAKIVRDGFRGDKFILPGFVDSHLHLESTLLPPASFAHLAVRHGTVAALCHPVEMTKLLGVSGIEYLLDQARMTPLKFFFSIPALSKLSLGEVEELWEYSEMKSLFQLSPNNPEVLAKIHSAEIHHKPIDHPPPTSLTQARQIKLEEKHVSIAHLNLLHSLLSGDPSSCSLCTEYLPPDELLLGHIGARVKQAVSLGVSPIDAIIAATKAPADHYHLEVGLLREGDPADFILVEDLNTFRVHATYIQGECVFQGEPLFPKIPPAPINRFEAKPINLVEVRSEYPRKRVKVDRFGKAPIKITQAPNLLLNRGGLALSTGDGILGIGASDEEICTAINAVIESKGGIALSHHGKVQLLPLPIGGLFSDLSGEVVGRMYGDFRDTAKRFGIEIPALSSSLSPGLLEKFP